MFIVNSDGKYITLRQYTPPPQETFGDIAKGSIRNIRRR